MQFYTESHSVSRGLDLSKFHAGCPQIFLLRLNFLLLVKKTTFINRQLITQYSQEQYILCIAQAHVKTFGDLGICQISSGVKEMNACLLISFQG